MSLFTQKFHRIISYFSFWMRSTNQHGVHSPFVYSMVTQCFYKKNTPESRNQIRKFIHTLLEDKHRITVKNLRRNSTILPAQKRPIKVITKKTGIPLKQALLLNRLTTYIGTTNALELGTSVGIGSASICLSNSDVKLTTIENCPETTLVAQSYFDRFDITNAYIRKDGFQSFLNSLSKETYDLIFLNVHQEEKETLSYIDQLIHHTHNDSIIILNDIYRSKEMTRAWINILQNPKVTLSIDTYHWGIIGFRKDQAKEHFCIRV